MKENVARTLISILFIGTAAAFGLTALPMKVMVETGRVAEFIPLYKGATSASTAMVPSAVTRPFHGTLDLLPGKSFHWIKNTTWSTRRVTWFRYTPTAGFTGLDSFTYNVNDGIGTSNTEKCVIRVHPGEPGNMTVLIVVNDRIMTALPAEVERLRTDIEAEGYRAVIKNYPNAQVPAPISNAVTARALWDTLRAEYDRGPMAGAILIGRLPGCPGSSNGFWDEAYWNLSVWLQEFISDGIHFALRDSVGDYKGLDTSSYGVYGRKRGLMGENLRHIWVTRMWGLDSWGQRDNAFGGEAKLIKRMLDANHHYRKGISRLPKTAWAIDNWGSKTFNPVRLEQIWPGQARKILKNAVIDTPYPVIPVYRSAGEYLDVNSHGGTNYFYPNQMGWGKAVSDSFMEYPFQVRFYVPSACHNAGCGNALNQHFFTRGGGAVFGTSAVEYVQSSGHFSLSYDTLWDKSVMRSLLASGKRWGRSWINGNMPVVCQIFYGDGTLAANMTPANALPSINSITGTRVSGNRMRITVDASDADGSVALYEYWINRKFDKGRNEPDTAGSSLGNLEFTFDSVTTVRLEVVDNYMARALAKFTVDPAAGTVNVRLTTAKETLPVAQPMEGLTLAPNPFRSGTRIRCSIREPGAFSVRIFDLSGRLVRSLTTAEVLTGTHDIAFDGRDLKGSPLAAGVYMVRVAVGGRAFQKQALLLR